MHKLAAGMAKQALTPPGIVEEVGLDGDLEVQLLLRQWRARCIRARQRSVHHRDQAHLDAFVAQDQPEYGGGRCMGGVSLNVGMHITHTRAVPCVCMWQPQ